MKDIEILSSDLNMSFNKVFRVGLFTVISFLTINLGCAQEKTQFLARKITIGGKVHNYQVFLPLNWKLKKTWPVVLFLHGAGERGNDGIRQTQEGIGPVIEKVHNDFPALVIFPQCQRGRWWTHQEMEALVLQSLETSIRDFNGDRSKVFLTGMSMGGYGTWYLAAKYPGKFSALAPICGGIVPPDGVKIPVDHPPIEISSNPYRTIASKIGKTPVWIFHGSEDPIVSVKESRIMAAALEALGGVVKYTEYEGIGHNSWDKAYAEPDFFPWLLSH